MAGLGVVVDIRLWVTSSWLELPSAVVVRDACTGNCLPDLWLPTSSPTYTAAVITVDSGGRADFVRSTRGIRLGSLGTDCSGPVVHSVPAEPLAPGGDLTLTCRGHLNVWPVLASGSASPAYVLRQAPAAGGDLC